MRRHAPIVALAAVLVAVPLALVGWNEARKRGGEHVLIQVRPVDPYDPFRGEYVALSYGISRLPHPGSEDGDTVYVSLHRDGPAWTGDVARPDRPDGGTFIRGRVQDGLIDYGIEAFFVQEGTARRYERALAARHLYADVVLQDDGGAHLDDLVTR